MTSNIRQALESALRFQRGTHRLVVVFDGPADEALSMPVYSLGAGKTKALGFAKVGYGSRWFLLPPGVEADAVLELEFVREQNGKYFRVWRERKLTDL